jgi:hypothetical protein
MRGVEEGQSYQVVCQSVDTALEVASILQQAGYSNIGDRTLNTFRVWLVDMNAVLPIVAPRFPSLVINDVLKTYHGNITGPEGDRRWTRVPLAELLEHMGVGGYNDD